MVLDFGSHTDSESENTEMDFNLTKDVLEITVQSSSTVPVEVQDNIQLSSKQ